MLVTKCNQPIIHQQYSFQHGASVLGAGALLLWEKKIPPPPSWIRRERSRKIYPHPRMARRKTTAPGGQGYAHPGRYEHTHNHRGTTNRHTHKGGRGRSWHAHRGGHTSGEWHGTETGSTRHLATYAANQSTTLFRRLQRLIHMSLITCCPCIFVLT